MEKNQNDESRTQTIIISECPRCHQKMIVNDRYCKHCGFDIQATNEKETLLFGKEEPITAIMGADSISPSFNRESRQKIDLFKKIRGYLMALLGLLNMFLLFVPILSKRNVFHYLDQVHDTYNVDIFESLRLSKNATFFSIVRGISEYLKNPNKGFNTSMMLFVYDLAILVSLIGLIILGVGLLVVGFRSVIYGKELKKYLDVVGLNLIISMILIFALNCYGIGPLLIAILTLLSLIFFYISTLITKEKRFLFRNLIYKVISMSILLIILFISTYGMVKVNTRTGAILFNFDEMSPANIEEPTYFYCHGLILELMQFLQSSNGDEVFTSYTEVANTICFLAHFFYLILAILAFNSLVKSLSKQSIRFPIANIISSTLFFYVFLVSLLFFDKIVNDYAYASYLEDNNLYIQDAAEMNKLYAKTSIFINRFWLFSAIVLSLPSCVFSVFARKACLKKTY